MWSDGVLFADDCNCFVFFLLSLFLLHWAECVFGLVGLLWAAIWLESVFLVTERRDTLLVTLDFVFADTTFENFFLELQRLLVSKVIVYLWILLDYVSLIGTCNIHLGLRRVYQQIGFFDLPNVLYLRVLHAYKSLCWRLRIIKGVKMVKVIMRFLLVVVFV